MSQGSLNPKIRFLCKKMWPVARSQTDTQTDGRTHRVTTEGTFSGFQDFFLQPIIKDRPNNSYVKYVTGIPKAESQTDTKSENRGHHVRVAWLFSFNLSCSNNEKRWKTSTTPSCSGPIPALNIRGYLVPGPYLPTQYQKLMFIVPIVLVAKKNHTKLIYDMPWLLETVFFTSKLLQKEK